MGHSLIRSWCRLSGTGFQVDASQCWLPASGFQALVLRLQPSVSGVAAVAGQFWLIYLNWLCRFIMGRLFKLKCDLVLLLGKHFGADQSG